MMVKSRIIMREMKNESCTSTSFSLKMMDRIDMQRLNLIELSEIQRYRKEKENYQKENERLREFSLELFKEGFRLGFKKGYEEALEKDEKD